jgi:exodeoxyribonuclease VII large subunit
MLPLPLVLQKIAVLTAESAAGYQDFLDQLHANPYGYCFHTQLFQTAMQGNAVEKEMTAQLRKIIHYTGGFDAVVIIRGGGAKLDLAAFDNLELGKAIANFPYPVFTGIGHEVDETVLDMVAHAAFKTPTATADFILHRNMQFESSVLNHALEVKTLTNVLLNRSSTSLHQSLQFIDFQVKSKLRHQDLLLNYIEKEIPSALRRVFQKTKSRLDSLENTVTLLSPETALKRGFSIVTKEGKPVISSNELQLGDDLEILLQQGEILTTVKQVKK